MTTIEIKKITESTAGFCDIIDLTAKLKGHIHQANICAGTATLFVSGSTAALTTIEHEPGLVQDLKEFIEKYIPSDRRYHHDDRWGDDNGFSDRARVFQPASNGGLESPPSIRAALFGPSLAIPIVNGAPSLGTWQQVILLDFDNRPRTRENLSKPRLLRRAQNYGVSKGGEHPLWSRPGLKPRPRSGFV